MNEEESVDFEGIAMRSDAIMHWRLIIIPRLGSPRERIDVGKQNTEIGAKTLNEIELTSRGEIREILN